MADPICRPPKYYFSLIFLKNNVPMSAILDPPFLILKIWRRIRNQRLKKPLGKYFHQHPWKITFQCPPVGSAILDFENLTSNLKLLSWIDSSKMNFFEKSTIFFSFFIYKSNIISNSANLTLYLCYFNT